MASKMNVKPFQDKKTGLWTGIIELPRDTVTNERRRKTIRRKNYDALVVELRKIRRTLEDHGDIPTSSTTVKVFMTYWLESINRSRPKTRAGYRSKIEQYIIPAIGKVKLDQLNPADVRKLERFIIVDKKLSSTSALQAYQILKKALDDAEREGRVVRNVTRLVDPPVRAVVKSTVLHTAQAALVIGSVTDDRLGSRWATALLTGMRQGEALGIELDRVDLNSNILDLSWQLQRVAWRHGCGPSTGLDDKDRPMYPCGKLRGTDCGTRLLDAPSNWEHRHLTGGLYLSRPKSKAGWRQIPLVDPLRAILERRIVAATAEPNPHGLLWTADKKMTKNTRQPLELDGSPIDPSRDNAAWHRVLVAAGVPDMRLHDARHTAVTLLYDLGVPETVIQQIVGQSTVATTRAYRHKNQQPAIEALAKLGQLLSITP